MSDMLRRGNQWLAEKMQQHAARAVRYIRGAHVIELRATIGSTIFEAENGAITVESQVRDYMFPVADLQIDGDLIEPQKGDRIEEVESGRVWVYEVNGLGGEPCWRFSDPHRTLYRVHTRWIGDA